MQVYSVIFTKTENELKTAVCFEQTLQLREQDRPSSLVHFSDMALGLHRPSASLEGRLLALVWTGSAGDNSEKPQISALQWKEKDQP